jgi:hypothetical protein
MAKLSETVWEEIGTLWRSGTASSLWAKIYSITRQTVDDRAKRYGWARDLSADIDLATDEKLRGLRSGCSPEERATAVDIRDDPAAASTRAFQKNPRHQRS